MSRYVVLISTCLFLFTLTSDCRQINQRIYGGQPTTEGEFPFLVSLRKNDEHFCSGFIYNARFIVTAASCVIDLNPSDVTVVVGQHSLIFTDPYERRYQLFDIQLHGSYDSIYKSNNLALLETSQSIVMTKDHVEVGYYNAVNNSVTESTVMGWGVTEEGGLVSPDLLKAVLQVLPKDDCSIYGADVFNPNNVICAGSDTASPCTYDEGSPLFQNGYIIGIVSGNMGCREPFLPTLFTRLAPSYSTWLQIYAGKQPPPLVPAVQLKN